MIRSRVVFVLFLALITAISTVPLFDDESTNATIVTKMIQSTTNDTDDKIFVSFHILYNIETLNDTSTDEIDSTIAIVDHLLFGIEDESTTVESTTGEDSESSPSNNVNGA